jgi:hypothetical protein
VIHLCALGGALSFGLVGLKDGILHHGPWTGALEGLAAAVVGGTASAVVCVLLIGVTGAILFGIIWVHERLTAWRARKSNPGDGN